MDVLRGITQNKKETPQEYINQFTKVKVEMGVTNDGLKC